MKFHHLVVTIICTFIIAVLSTSLFFTTNIGDHRLAARKLIQTVFHDKVDIICEFSSPANLQGFIIQSKAKNGEMRVLYTDRKGRYIFDGNIIDKKGDSLTTQEFKKYTTPKKPENIVKKIDQTNWIEQGHANAPHKAYIIIDPNCPYCHYLYETLQPIIMKGQITIRWLVVGMLSPSSPGSTVAILAAKDQLLALKENETDFNLTTTKGGITPLMHPTKAQYRLLTTNDDFIKNYRLFQTPTILFKSVNAETIMQIGVPDADTLESLIQEMGSQF